VPKVPEVCMWREVLGSPVPIPVPFELKNSLCVELVASHMKKLSELLELASVPIA
jgi:hypothetical protein